MRRLTTCAVTDCDGTFDPDLSPHNRKYCDRCSNAGGDKRRTRYKTRAEAAAVPSQGLGRIRCTICDRPVVEHAIVTRCYDVAMNRVYG